MVLCGICMCCHYSRNGLPTIGGSQIWMAPFSSNDLMNGNSDVHSTTSTYPKPKCEMKVNEMRAKSKTGELPRTCLAAAGMALACACTGVRPLDHREFLKRASRGLRCATLRFRGRRPAKNPGFSGIHAAAIVSSKSFIHLCIAAFSHSASTSLQWLCAICLNSASTSFL